MIMSLITVGPSGAQSHSHLNISFLRQPGGELSKKPHQANDGILGPAAQAALVTGQPHQKILENEESI